MRARSFALECRLPGSERGANRGTHLLCAGSFTRCAENCTPRLSPHRCSCIETPLSCLAATHNPDYKRTPFMASLSFTQPWPRALRAMSHACGMDEDRRSRTVRGMLRLAWELVTRDRGQVLAVQPTLRGMLRWAWELVTRDRSSAVQKAVRTSPHRTHRTPRNGKAASVAQALQIPSSSLRSCAVPFTANDVQFTDGSLHPVRVARRPLISPARRSALSARRLVASGPARVQVCARLEATGLGCAALSSDFVFPSPQHSHNGRTSSHFLARKEGL